MGSRVIFGIAVAVGTVVMAVYPLVGSEKPAMVGADEKLARGAYLVKMGGCGDCHTPKNMTQHGVEEDTTRMFSGHPSGEAVPAPPSDLSMTGWVAACNGHMTAWVGPWGISYAANISSDKKTGLGNWTDDQFIQAMRTGKHRGFGRAILPPMPWFNLQKASDEDLSAMLAYLKSTRPIENQVPEPVPPTAR